MALERFYGDHHQTTAPEHFSPSSQKVSSALELAKQAHDGQFRKSGEPFYHHPIAVAQIISSWGLGEDEDLIAAALLHDVPEDNNSVSVIDIKKQFGEGVARIVEGVTKVDDQTSQDIDSDTIRKVSASSYLEPKVALVKLADRLHNMRTLGAMKPEKQREKAIESLTIYAKLAQSLGLWEVKKELEDLSFQYLDSENYAQTVESINHDPRLNPNFLSHMSSLLETILEEKGIPGRVVIRINGYCGLHQKKEAALISGKTSAEKGFLDINDVVSFRIITTKLEDCYRAVGLVHHHFGEHVDFERYDEYIGANKRMNGYSAIQTTLDLPQGAVEIAFVTEDMESFNRRGVASLLKDGEKNIDEYVLKSVFSKDGEVVFLPKTATGVDYAYTLSAVLGANAHHLIVDGVEKPLTTVIRNASTVEVIVGDSRRAPDPDVMNYCLPPTKAIILEQLNLSESDKLVLLGKQIAEEVLSPRGLLRLEDLGSLVSELVFDFRKNDIRDIYGMLGRGAFTKAAINKWLDEHEITKDRIGYTTIRISGFDQPSILSDLSTWISESGGNIRAIDHKTQNGSFTILLVVNGLNTTSETNITQRLSNDDRFDNWKLV